MGIKQLLSNLVKINGKKRALLVIPLLLIFSGYGCFVDTTLPEIELLPTDTLSPTSTFTPVPTEVSTDAPTKTIPYTSTFTSTPTKTIPPTSTYTPVPTETLIPTPEPTATNAPVLGALIRIKAVNKQDEYVDLENIGDQPQNITGWILVSEKGNQQCILGGEMQPGSVLRVWASNPSGGGFNCGFDGPIWNNSESDPAVLYDSNGQEIDRFP